MVCADGTLCTGRGVHREEEKSNELKIPYTGGRNNSSNVGNTETNSFTVAFKSATVEQIKDYAAKVKAAGFNINEEVEDQEVMGMVIYSFTAENADGYTVEITSANGTSSLSISK